MTALTHSRPAAGVAADTRNIGYQELKSRIHQDLLNRLNLDRLTRVKREDAEPEIRSLIGGMLDRERDKTPLSLYERESMVSDVLHELFGLGPLELLLHDPSVSDILVNRFDQIYVERNGRLEPTDITFKDERHLQQIIERIVSSIGRRIDESSPMVDARLADGSRVNAIIPPLALDGAVLSIRRFRTDKLGADDLVGRESWTEPMKQFLEAAVGCRLNIVVSGGTGAGKTTLLNILSSFINDHERVVTIEDAAELKLRQRHVVRLETRPANIEGKGAVRQRDLVVNALRMRPDRIIVGEVRSEEALDMLQAMNTGHDGSLTTIHANTPRDALYRLDTMVAMANLNIPEKAIRAADRVGRQPGRADQPHGGRHQESDGDLRDHRHGRRGHHHAGHLPVRTLRPRPGWPRARAVQGDRASGRSARNGSPRRACTCRADMFEHVKVIQ